MSGKNIEVIDSGKQIALREINEQFGVVDTVRTLQKLMKDATAKEINTDSINAACNCVQNLNLTIKTAIQAARYLSEK